VTKNPNRTGCGTFRNHGLALVTILFYAILLTGLALLLMTLISRKQEEIFRIRSFIQAENLAQSGLEISLRRWADLGSPPGNFLVHWGKGRECEVQIEQTPSRVRIVARGSIRRGRFRVYRTLERDFPAHP